MPRSRIYATLVGSIALAATCSPPPGRSDAVDPARARAEIITTLERYLVAARAVNPEAIAGFFAPTGILLEPGIFPIRGRDSIRSFMASFPGVRVDSAIATPDTIEVLGGTALLWGSYFERLAFPGQPVSEQHGKFVIQWVRQGDGAWLIQRYYRVPLPGEPPGAE